jgi:hypothetical protein
VEPQAEDDAPIVRRWPPRLQAAAAVGWSAFLAASLGTMLVFAALDPQVLIDSLDPGEPGVPAWLLNRTAIYTLGFFLLWLVAGIAGLLTAYLTQGSRP